MTVQSIDSNTISNAVKDILNADSTVNGFVKNEIEIGTHVNDDPNQTPWIGIYRGTTRYEPRTLGAGNWEAYPSVRIVVQASHLRTAEACEELLEGYVVAVLNVVLSNVDLNGTVDMINTCNIEYGYNETEDESMFFQTAIITLELEVATQ